MIFKEIAWNVEEFFSTNKKVAAIVIRLNRKYRLKMVQVYATTFSYDDETVDSFYKCNEPAVNEGIPQFTRRLQCKSR